MSFGSNPSSESHNCFFADCVRCALFVQRLQFDKLEVTALLCTPSTLSLVLIVAPVDLVSVVFMYASSFSDSRGVTAFSRISNQQRRAVNITLCRTFEMIANMCEQMLSSVLYSLGMMPSTELSK